jgi:hypothetical protein
MEKCETADVRMRSFPAAAAGMPDSAGSTAYAREIAASRASSRARWLDSVPPEVIDPAPGEPKASALNSAMTQDSMTAGAALWSQESCEGLSAPISWSAATATVSGGQCRCATVCGCAGRTVCVGR